jgi:ClpP class serine protease
MPPFLGRPRAINPDAYSEFRARFDHLAQTPEVLARAQREHRAEEESEPVEGSGGLLRVLDGVGVIAVRGVLHQSSGGIDDWIISICGGTSYRAIWRAVETAQADPAIQAILLRVDSPGGDVTGCGELADFLGSASVDKPLWAYVEGQCASAAEWLVSQCDHVAAHHTALVGWIGVIRTILDISGAQDKAGIKEIEIVSGQSPDKRSFPIDEAVIDRAQVLADDLADRFIRTVARGRGLDASDVMKRFGRGDGMIAAKALTAGLIDEMSHFNATLSDLRAEAARAKNPVPSRPGPSAGVRAKARKETTMPVPTKPTHRATTDKDDDKKSDAAAKRAEAEKFDKDAEGKRASAEAKRAEAKKMRGEAENFDKDGEHAKARARRAEADRCEAEADDMESEAGDFEKQAEAARAEADKMDDHDEPDGDEDKKALSALSGLRASASIAAHTAAIEAKMVPRSAVTALERRLARIEDEKKFEQEKAEAAKVTELVAAAEARGYFAGLKDDALKVKRDRFAAIARREPDAAREIIESMPTSRVLGRQTAGGRPVGGQQSSTPRIDPFTEESGRRVTHGDRDFIEIGSPDLMSRAEAHAAQHKCSIEDAMVAVVKADPALIR